MTPDQARAILRSLGISQADLVRTLTAARTDGRQTTPAMISRQLTNIGSYPALALLLDAWAKTPHLMPPR